VTACFCGCGRSVGRFPITRRAINTRGRLVRERLDWARGVDLPTDAAWEQEGETILLELRAVVHGELEPKQVHEPRVRRWQAVGHQLERDAVRSRAPSLRRWLADRD
jgi:hypothetical protein